MTARTYVQVQMRRIMTRMRAWKLKRADWGKFQDIIPFADWEADVPCGGWAEGEMVGRKSVTLLRL